MRSRATVMLVVALALMAAAAVFLGRLQSFQRMGRPGVKVVARPVYNPAGEVVGTNWVDLPERVLDYRSKEIPVEPLVLNWLPKDTVYGQRIYSSPTGLPGATNGFQAALNVVLMGSDRTSIHKPQYCLTGAGWRILETEQTTVRIAEPHPYDLPVVKLTCERRAPRADGSSELRRGLYVYWFVADGQLSSDHLQRMWWMARDMIREGIWQRWAYVACFSVCLPGQEDATYGRMNELIAAAVPRFQLASGAPVKRGRP